MHAKACRHTEPDRQYKNIKYVGDIISAKGWYTRERESMREKGY